MANITEIQGTDSLSSSRITINNNFSALNDDLANVIDILDPIAANITGLSSITTEAASIVAGGTQIATLNSTTATFGVQSVFNSGVILASTIRKSGVVGSAVAPLNTLNNAIVSIEAATYIVNADFSLPNGLDGQEVTIISESAAQIALNTNTGNIGAQLVTLPNRNSNITLRFFGSKWYIVAHVGANITL